MSLGNGSIHWLINTTLTGV